MYHFTGYHLFICPFTYLMHLALDPSSQCHVSPSPRMLTLIPLTIYLMHNKYNTKVGPYKENFHRPFRGHVASASA